jgi:hypothetical protein
VKTVLIIFLSGIACAAFAQQQEPANRAVFTSPEPQTIVVKPTTGTASQQGNAEHVVFTSPEPTVIKGKPAQTTGAQKERVVFTSPAPQVKKDDNK